MNVMTLYFIREENKQQRRVKKIPIKKLSKTKKRKMKRLRKIKNVEPSSNEMVVDATTKK